MKPMSRAGTILVLVGALMGSVMLLPAAAAGPGALVGTFAISDGRCSPQQTEAPTGSYFAMLTGASLAGPFVANGSSADASGPCANKNYTPLLAGTDGGLKTGAYQPNPSPPFDGKGNALGALIIRPVSFFGTSFALSTQPVDPQTKLGVTAPQIIDTGGQLSGDLRAIDVAYSNEYFNQGAPKPDGSLPALTRRMQGTIACDGTYSLTWSSTIVGGPFNKFTGSWHLTGTFRPANGTVADALGCSTPVAAASGSGGGGGGGFPVVPAILGVLVVAILIGGGVALRGRARG